MPLYEYRCPCGEEEERIRPMGKRDAPLFCVVCGSPMERVKFHKTKWQWGPAAASHGWFIKECRKGFTNVDTSVRRTPHRLPENWKPDG